MIEYIKSMRQYIGHERLLIVGASVFIHRNGELLLQKRRDNGCWADHGGCVELGENPEETARRELFEETGLIAGKLTLLGVFGGEELNYTYPNGDKVSIVSISYLCEDYRGELTPQESEVAGLAWFPIDALPENISPPVRPMLNKCVESLRARKKQTEVDYKILPIDPPFRACANKIIADEWSGPMIASRGRLIDTAACPGFVAVREDEVLGCITYEIQNGECEIATLNSLAPGHGIGAALLRAAICAAKNAGCRRVLLITTNDNTQAMRYYQRFGFSLACVHMNALTSARALKRSIPELGDGGIPILHEFEFEIALS